MEILKDVDLSKKTTFHIGGTACNYYIPESVDDLIFVLNKEIGNEQYYIFSGGSNLLINNKKTFKHVIDMGKTDKTITEKENGLFYVGASVRIQSFIKKINASGYGGIEELIGLPALMGGIIYMNAGIGSKEKCKFNVSEFIRKVYVLKKDTLELMWIAAEDCDFGHRKSIFQNNDYIILGAEFQFPQQTIEVSNEKIKKRQEYCKKNQNYAKGCFGSCFCEYSKTILTLISKLKLHKGNVMQSDNNINWLINTGNGTYEDAIWLINKCKRWHKIVGKKIKCEVIIWE